MLLNITTLILAFIAVADIILCHRSISNIEELVTLLQNLNISNICHQNTTDERCQRSFMLANYECSKLCPSVSIIPSTEYELSNIITTISNYLIPMRIRGGGHGYTCQATLNCKSVGVMIDMQLFNQIQIIEDNDTNGNISTNPYMIIGSGTRWKDILPILQQNNYITVHGQCTGVGTAGFLLHDYIINEYITTVNTHLLYLFDNAHIYVIHIGGVHFGGLSHLYGLGVDNIIGMTVITANGNINKLNDTHCLVYNSNHYASENANILINNSDINNDYIVYDMSVNKSCEDLWFAMRGAGSSFGVVTSITVKLYQKPRIITALSTLSLNLNNIQHAVNFLQHYMELIPSNISMTFFTLDEYFKTYFFNIYYSQNKWHAIKYDILSLLLKNHYSSDSTRNNINTNINTNITTSKNSSASRMKDKYFVHMVIEIAWVTTSTSIETDDTYIYMQNLHKQLIYNLTNSNYNNNNNNNTSSSNISFSAPELKELVKLRSWLVTNDFWSVPSYDLVWGSGHSYGGASVATGKNLMTKVLITTLKKYKEYLYNKPCSDCVLVIHRVGDSIRNTGLLALRKSSMNPIRTQLSIWIELDCGQFYRQRKSWKKCSTYIDSVQNALDNDTECNTSYENFENVYNTTVIDSVTQAKFNVSANNVVPTCDSTINDTVTQCHTTNVATIIKENNIINNKIGVERFHYPNVPNLVTHHWQDQYYGNDNYHVLQKIKAFWDPKNIFSHAQSIELPNFTNTNDYIEVSLYNNDNTNYNNEDSYSNSNELISNECIHPPKHRSTTSTRSWD